MCGIVGVFRFSGYGDPITPPLIESMRDTMIHRGPDDCGFYISPDRRVGLGHRRLSIIDLSSAGHQPMSNEDGTIWIVFNGEIYNHEKIRKRLIKAGHKYKSRTDTETIIHLYEEVGPDCVNEIEGMFSFCIWDQNKKRMFLARDRMGKKPLYYTIQNGLFIFASEIKAILEHPEIKRDLDPEAFYHYLTFAITPAPFTLFSGIKKLACGYSMLMGEEGTPVINRYWDAIFPTRNDISEEECIQNIRCFLSRSVEKRMMSDVPFGVFLSGGIDSSTNVALMAGLMNQPVRTFSVGFADQPHMNEFEYASQVAREFKTDHHEIIITHKDLMDYVPSLIFHQDEPIADWVCVPLYFVSKLARDSDTIVIQIGEGSDEIFFGYDGYKIMLDIYNRYWTPYMQLPAFIRKLFYRILSPYFMMRREITKEDILRRAAINQEFYWGGAIPHYENQKHRILGRGFPDNKTYDSHDIVREHTDHLKEIKPEADYVEQMIYLELKIRLPELLLMRVDKIVMSTSVEGRAPYLDQDLVKFVMSIPTGLKIKNGVTKYILKKSVEGLIPDNIIYRKKQGFGAPVKEWFTGELGQYITDGILNSGLRKREWLNYRKMEELLRAQREDRFDQSFALWNIFNLSKWYDYWIEKRPVS
ncbi:MAG: asparagine synthase (glutamine-hydrolyzing) [Candidatus Eremiobacteraeota bacterium]|nr:asparagine synthase (glutamine-hydrolyzing) [Candidatus Eremiobacteraeota bacterium]